MKSITTTTLFLLVTFLFFQQSILATTTYNLDSELLVTSSKTENKICKEDAWITNNPDKKTAKSITDVAQHWASYQVADCQSEHLAYQKYLNAKNYKSQVNSSNTIASSMMECGKLSLYSLLEVPGFPQIDELVVCSGPDTLSLLVYNNSPYTLQGVEIHIEFDPGLSYGGEVHANNSPATVTELNVSNPYTPSFLTSPIDSNALVIANIQVKADCDINLLSEELSLDAVVKYQYTNEFGELIECEERIDRIGNYNSIIKVPVLNILGVAPTQASTNNLTDPACQTILLSQDGIDAYVDEATFIIDGVDLVHDYSLASFTINGLPAPTYAYDTINQQLSLQIDGNYFPSNGNLNNGDNLWDENETVEIEVCYLVNDCTDNAQSIDYKTYYGCNDEICFDISEKSASVVLTPDFGAVPEIANSEVLQTGEFCGDLLIYEFTVQSANPHPLEGLWRDVVIRWPRCENDVTNTVNVYINDTLITGSAYPANSPTHVNYQPEGWPNWRHLNATTTTVETWRFTSDIDGPGGLDDIDGDGRFDDLPGGESLTIRVEVEVLCAEDEIECQPIECSIEQIEIRGIRDCIFPFQQFAPLTEPITYRYGRNSFANNEDEAYANVPITEQIVVQNCDWTPSNDGFLHEYSFDKINIEACPNSNLFLRARITSNRYRDLDFIRYEAGSATYNGVAVPGVTFVPELDPISGDTAAYLLTIPAGDAANDNTNHSYYWNLEFTEQCASWSWLFHEVEVVEECMGCGETDPCEIIRSCDDLRSRVSNWSGCNCVGTGCQVRTWLDTLHRCNFGYADKEMTQKLTLDDIPVEDQLRFLPGDTMYIRQVVEILDPSIFDIDRDYYWQFSIIERQTYLPGRFDKFNAEFVGWSFQDVSGSPAVDLGLPDCFESYPHTTRGNTRFPSAVLENLGVDSYGSWNNINQAGDDYFQCDTDSNINPEFPTTHAHYDILGNNVDDMRFSLYFRRPESCPQWSREADDTTWHDNDCYNDLMNTLGTIEAGDRFYIEYKVPIIHNPLYDLQQLNEDFVDPTIQDLSGQELRPAASFRGTDPIDCSAPAVGACSEYYYYEFHIPGPVEINHDVLVKDCEITVNHSFSLSNQVPDVPVGQKPWYENEYRPFMYAEYINPMYTSNLVYQGKARIINQLGDTTDISDSYDADYSNLECFDDSNGGECCISNDGTGLSTLRFNDDDFYVAKNMPYAGYYPSSGQVPLNNPNNGGAYHTNGTNPQLCLNGIPLIQKANDPFPALTVGGEENTCSWALEYDLFAICPEELSSEDFKVVTQFIEPYFFYWPEHVGYLGHWNVPNTTFGWDYRFSQELGFNPYAASGVYLYGRPTPNDGDGLSDYVYTDIVFDPDASNGFYHDGIGNNPYRQSDTTLLSINDVTDMSQDYPPLIGSFQNFLIADLEDEDDTNVYQICAGSPGSTGATHENVYHILNVPTNTDFLGFEDLNGNVLPATLVESTADYNEYAVSTPDLAPGECFEFRILTELLFCPVNTDEEAVLCMRTSTGCFDYEKTILLASTADACAATEACYEYIKEEADLQVEWTIEAEELQGLCDTISLGTRIKNVKPARLINLHPYWYFPQGLQFVPGSFEVQYPGGPGNYGTSISIPDPTPDPTQNSVFGTFFEYTDDALWSSVIDQEGLVGIVNDVGQITQGDSTKVHFTFDVYTACEDFVSGSSLWFQTEASDPCEKTISSMLVESDIIIQNANPADFAQFYTFSDDLDLYCGLEDTLVLTYLNISPFGETKNSMMCLDIDPTQIDYMMGSLFFISPPNFNGNITTETTNGNIIHVCMEVPDGIQPNEAFQLGLKVKPAEDLPCGNTNFGVAVTSTIMDQSCAALNKICNVQVLNTVNSYIEVIYNPPVEILEHNLTFECDADPDSVTYNYEVKLMNDGAPFTNNVTVFLHQDLDNNGSLDNYDPLLDSETTSVMLATMQNTTLSGQFTVPTDAACPVILYVMQETDCVCDAQEFLYTSVEPASIAAFDGFATLCPGDDLKIPYCSEMTMEANPAAGATFIYDTDSVTIQINNGYGINSPVEITTSTGIDDCSGEEASLYISVLDRFDFGPYDTLEVCETGCTRLDLNLPTSVINSISVQWTPTDYLDDPTSLYPTVCNPDSSITYEVELTFMDGGSVCSYFANYPIKVDTVPVNDLFDNSFLCPDPASHTYIAPAGYDNYIWYLIDEATGILTPIQAGAIDTFIPTNPGEYFLEYYNTSDLCVAKSTPFDVYDCLEMEKGLTDIMENATANEYTVSYTIEVVNPSTINQHYDLFDLPGFDTDISIISAAYTSDVALSGTLPLPPPTTGWQLADSLLITPTDTQTYVITYVVQIDLSDGGTADSGDDTYTACGQTIEGVLISGEGLFNQAMLDVDDDGEPDVIDEDCGDLPFIVMQKDHTSTVETSTNCYDVTYTIVVENTGGANGEYDLFDTQGFDTDFQINTVSFTTTATGLTGSTLPTTGTYTLADDQGIAAMQVDSFVIVYSVCLNLKDADSQGNEVYDASCESTNGTTSETGEGLHNEATIDVNNDGEPEITDIACEDVPYFTLEKTIGIPEVNPDLSFNVSYEIVVCNIGGIPDDYTLYDLPNFDNDIVINSASYTSTIGASGSLSLPVPTTPGWTLATAQSLTPVGCDTFVLTVNIEMDLTDGVIGDDVYTSCGATIGSNPIGGEGLFNEAHLDADSDGDIDLTEEVCGELKSFDLALIKTTNQTTPVQINDVVRFDITVCNQGESAADSIEVTDYIPSCMSFSPNNGWVANANGDAVITLTTNNGGLPATGLPSSETSTDTCITIPIDLTIICSNPDSLINYAEITASLDEFGNPVDIDSEAGSNSADENTVHPNDPADDHTGDDGMDSDGDGITDEDDHDPATVPVVDIALAKTIPPTMSGPYTYGQVLSFNIEVINQGNVDLQNIAIIDYIPCGYSYSPTNNSKTPAWTLSNGDATTTIANLDAGQSDTLTIDLIIQPVPDTCANADAYTNYSEVTYMEDDDGTDMSDHDIDSSADDDDNNDTGGTPDSDEDDHVSDDGMDGDGDGITDEDDHDPERIEIFDLALAKIISPEFTNPVKLGQDVPYDIWIFNQGNVTATNIENTEEIPAGMSVSTADTNGWTDMDNNGLYETTIAGPLLPGDSILVEIILTVDAIPDPAAYVNEAEISDAADENGDPVKDVDSKPDDDMDNDAGGDPDNDTNNHTDDDGNDGNGDGITDEDDHDPEALPIFDLALKKTTMDMGPFKYGDTIAFDFTVYNQGNISSTNIEITEQTPCGYLYDATLNPDWTASTGNTATTLITDTLQSGDSAIVSINFIIQPCAMLGAWQNTGEISASEDDEGNDTTDSDIDSDADDDPDNDGEMEDNTTDNENGDEDDSDFEVIDIFDLAQIKQTVTPGPYAIGQLIEYKITVVNQGNTNASNIIVTDSLPAGLSFDAADNPLWSDIGSSKHEYTITTVLEPLDTFCIPLWVTIEATTGGNENYTNVSEITESEDDMGNDTTNKDADDDDGEPDDNQDEEDDSYEDGDDDRDTEVIEVCFAVEGILVIDAECGEDNGSITIDLIGNDTVGVNYVWSDGISTTNMASNLSPDIYTVTLSNGVESCNDTLEIIVGNVDGPNLTIAAMQPSTCPDDNGSATLTWEGGVAPFAISIDGGTAINTGATTFIFNNLTTGMHSIEVVDANGCKGVLSITIEQEGGLTVNATGITDANCGQADGATSITVTPTGTYTYTWSDGGSSDTRNNLAGGIYTVTVSGANDCTGETQIMINDVGVAMPTVMKTEVTCANTCNGSITITKADGTCTVLNMDDENVTMKAANGELCAGEYIVQYTDLNGCMTFEAVTISESAAIDVFVEITPVACEDGKICVTNVLGGTGAYTYTWSGTNIDGLTDSCVSIVQAGIYTLVVTDENGCEKSVEIPVQDEGCCFTIGGLVVIDAACGEDNGSATIDIIGGDASVITYTWSDGVSTTNTANNLSPGIYSVLIQNGMPECTQVLEVAVGNTDAPNLMVAAISPMVCPEENGTITLTWENGTAPFAISIDGGAATNTGAATFTFSDLAAGTHTIEIIDAGGCKDYLSITIENEGGIELIVESTTDAGCNEANGAATLSGIPFNAYTYNWSDGGTGDTRTDLPSGIYTITASDANGCTGETSLVINNTGVTMPTLSSTNITCTNACDGSIIFPPSTGTFALTDANGVSILLALADGNLCAGEYQITYTDVAGCMAFDTLVITQPDAIDVYLEVTPVTCTNGEICITNVLGGTGAYTYTWSGTGIEGVTDSCVTITTGGIYTLNVMDENGCDKSIEINVAEEGCCFIPEGIFVIDAACGEDNGSVAIDIVGGDESTLTYTWSDNVSTTNMANNLSAGIYYVTIENGKPECTQVLEIPIGNVGAPNLLVDSLSPAICPADNGSVTVSWENGTAPFDISIDGGAVASTSASSFIFSNLATGSHAIKIVDTNGCEDYLAITIEIDGGLTVNVDNTTDADCNLSNGSATINVTPTGTYSYTWSDGGTGTTRTNLASGVYTVTASDANGCTGETTVLINNINTAMPIISSTDVKCINACDGSINLNTSTGTFTITDEGGNNITLAQVNGNLCSGQYIVEYMEAGCSHFDTVIINQSEAIDVFVEITSLACNQGEICVTNVLGGNGDYTYTWMSPNGSTSSDSCVMATTRGSYTLNVMDSNGCNKIVEIPMLDEICCFTPSGLVVIDAVCGDSTGSVSVDILEGDETNITYLWSNGNTTSTATNLSAGNYSVTIENGQPACTQVLEIGVGNVGGPNLSIDASSPATCPANNGSVTLSWTGGTEPFDFYLNSTTPILTTNNTTQTISNLAAGTYTFEVEDANGCRGVLPVTIEQDGGLVVSADNIQEADCGAANGAATISVTPAGTYTYIWNDGGTGSNRTNLTSGIYTVSVNAANDCTGEVQVIINDALADMPIFTTTDVSCFDACDGSILLTTGAGVFVVTDSSGNNIPLTLTNGSLCAGEYTIKYTDENGCNNFDTLTIAQPDAFDVYLEVAPIVCREGHICVTDVIGANGNYTYLWSGPDVEGITDTCITVTEEAIYTLTVSDDMGCDKRIEIFVEYIDCIVDLALKKTTIETGPFVYGDTVTFDFTVYNQGNFPATNIEVSEYTPCGFIFNPTLNPNWLDGPNNTATTIITDTLLAGDSSVVSVDLIIQPCDSVDAWKNTGEISGSEDEIGNDTTDDDIDSDADNNPENDDDMEDNATDGSNGDEDDSDFEIIDIFDLAQVKDIATPTPYMFGDTLTFNVTVTNEGNVPATNIEITDHLPAAYAFNTALNPDWNTTTAPAYTYLITDTLLSGESQIIPFHVILMMTEGDSEAFTNISEISMAQDTTGMNPEDADSDPDDDPDNDPEEEDDHDPETIQVFDLALKKTTVETGPFAYGDTVTFDFTVINQGNINATNIDITEFTPCGFAFDAAINPNWNLVGGNPITTITDTLIAGDSTSVSIDLIIQSCNQLGAWKNTGEISGSEDDEGNDTTDDDIDSDADDDPDNDGEMEDNATNGFNGDEDDSDFEEIQIFDLAQIKQITTPAPYAFGDTVTFDITVVNQGNIPATNIEISDHLPAAYAFDAALNPNWDTGNASTYTYLITDTLSMNDTITISFHVILMMTEGDSDAFTNISEISMAQDTMGMDGEDADSNPDGDPNNDGDPDNDSFDDDEDDHDPETIQVFDLALKKTTSATGPFAYGDIVTFDFTVYNQGNINATNIEITEVTPCGFAFDPALNSDWSLVGNHPTTTITNLLLAGESTVVSIDLIVQPCSQPNAWKNTGEISGSEDDNGNDTTDDDIDSDADDDPNNDGDMEDDATDGSNNDEDDSDFEEIQIFDLALTKILSPTQSETVSPGDLVEYIFTVYNQGNVSAYDIDVLEYIPLGLVFDPLDNTTSQTGNANNWTQNGSNASYTVNQLLPLDQISITIRLRVDYSFGGTQILNIGEIAHAAAEPGGSTAQDADSVADGEESNDNGAGPADDNMINNENGDEDDHDPAIILVQQITSGISYQVEDRCACQEDGTVTERIIILSDSPNENWMLMENEGLLTTTGTTASFIDSHNGSYRYELVISYNSGEEYISKIEFGEEAITISGSCTCPDTEEEEEIEPEEEPDTIIEEEEGDEGATPAFPVEEEAPCKQTTYCIHGIAIELMPVGMVEIWAKDLAVNPDMHCENTWLSLWHPSMPVPQPTTVDEVMGLPNFLIFTCEHLGNQDVQLHTVDAEGNWNYCKTYVNVQDNNKSCPQEEEVVMPEGVARIAGQVNSWKGEAIEYVEVDMHTEQYETSASGFYHFDVPMHDEYTITPNKNKNPLNGVSTYDLVLISKHILGIQPFDNPYQWIAADANRSNTVTTFDMVQLRRLILAIDTQFSNNTSWRFVAEGHSFMTNNPLAGVFEESYQIENLTGNELIDFVGVKIGDVNGNARPNSLHESIVRVSPDIFKIEVQDQQLKAGQSYKIQFTTKQLQQIQGYQFTLNTAQVRIDKVTGGIMELEHFGLQGLDRGQITASWNQPTVDGEQSMVDGITDQLFTLQLLALQNVKLSEVLSINNRPTVVEAYDQAGNIMEVHLNFTTSMDNSIFELYQNEPNPFQDITTIEYLLPGDSDATLTLRDEAGRVLQVIRQDGKAGLNQFQLHELDLPAGFIYYQLTTKYGLKSKKMLRLK